MEISKALWDRYIEAKRELVVLEREHADVEERMLAAQTGVAEFEELGISFDAERGLICIDAKQIGSQSGLRAGASATAAVTAEDLF